MKSRRMIWMGMYHTWGDDKYVQNFAEGNRVLGRCMLELENNIKMALGEIGRRMWTGLIWLRIGTSGRLL
jgi:hypothetical protein